MYDFIGRLEFAAKHWDKGQGLYEKSLEWQAAREIERLTAENERLRAENVDLRLALSRLGWDNPERLFSYQQSDSKEKQNGPLDK